MKPPREAGNEENMPADLNRNRIRLLLSLPLLAPVFAHGGEAREDTLETVEVTATRIGTSLEAERALTPGSVTLLDADSFRERSVTQLADMLRYVPGVWAESYNGNDDVFYSSRGSNLDATDYDKNGIKFLLDGLPVSGADGNNHNRALDPQHARFVTVAHGANALAYGASTLGGAIDVTSPTARDTAPFSAGVSAGSFGQWSLRSTLGAAGEKLDGLLMVETQQRDGYRDHSRQDRRNAYANLGWQVSDRALLRFYASWSDYDAELPRELSRAAYLADARQARPDAVAGDHGKQVEAGRLAVKATLAEVAGGTLEFGLSHEQQSLYHPIVSTPFFSLLIDTDHDNSGAMLRFNRAAGDHSLLFGANYGFSEVKGGNYENIGGRRGALMWNTDDEASSLELFAVDRWRFAPRWTLVYGAQYSHARRETGGVEASYNAFNPRLGVIYAASAASEWYASVGRIHEAPTTYELTDEASGDGRALDAMHGVVVESGLRGAGSNGRRQFHWDVSAYYTALRDEILSVDDPAAPGTSLATNIDRTTHAGVEALLGASLPLGGSGHRIEPMLSATFNAFSFDSDPTWGNNRLASAPRWFARGELMYRPAASFAIGPTFDVVGERYVDFANTLRVGSHALFGARASWSSARWDVYAEARNLFDRRHVATVLVRDQAAPDAEVLFPGAPRSVYVGAHYRF
jgi:iron complex outermembrane receptor protein